MHDAKWLFPQAGAPKERSLLLGEEEKATLYELKKVYVYSENALICLRAAKICVAWARATLSKRGIHHESQVHLQQHCTYSVDHCHDVCNGL
jgi:hypothetical protein